MFVAVNFNGIPVTDRILLGICAMDYLGNPYLNADTPGLIVDDVSLALNDSVFGADTFLSPQIMHKILVKPLPPGCHLTAIFDVRTINNLIKHEYTDVSALPVVPFRDCFRCVFLQYLWTPAVTYNIQDLPHIVCQFPSNPLLSRLTNAAQYRSDGVVKKFKHPFRLEVLREKESKAVAVSATFLSGNLFSHAVNFLRSR